jgi:hypothetical protein
VIFTYRTTRLKPQANHNKFVQYQESVEIVRTLLSVVLIFLFSSLSVTWATAYTYTTSLTDSQTFPTLSAAETAMHATSTDAALLQFDTNISQTSRQVISLYKISPVEPIAGPWDYGFNRCAVLRYGYPTEQSALNAGMLSYYNHCNDSHVNDPRTWGGYGACGSSKWYRIHKC